MTKPEDTTAAEGRPFERPVGRLEPERARHTTSAPRWMEGWDD